MELNRSVLNHDYYTDIITLDYTHDQDYECSELHISLDRIEENAKKYMSNFIDELHRVIIHGMLHLAGFTDKTLEEKQKMRGLENSYLALHRST